MPPALPRFSSAASTDQGSVRPNNEDRVYCDEERGFFLVVDGMGGHEAGEHAAEIAVERIRARLERQSGSAEQRLREAIALANNAIYEAARENPDWSGMACVLTAALLDNGHVAVGHVGDSRLYKLKRGVIEKITHDHSPVGEREDGGELTEAEAMAHPRRNEVFRDVGSEEHAPDDADFIEIAAFPFEPDSAFLLCSDGLSDALPAQEIQRIVEQNAGDPQSAVHNLIAAANKIGRDNISAVLVEAESFAASLGRAAAGESTDRFASSVTIPVPWYRSAPAWFFYGVIIGALLLFAAQKFGRKKPQRGPKIFAVTAPSTIAAALANAQPGDSISVAPGMYSETLHLKDGVTVTARQPHDSLLRGSVEADGVRYARLEGLQIRGADIAIHIRNSNVVLASDDVAAAKTAGIELDGDSRGVISACNIHDNAGPGILLTGAAAPAIEYNLIYQNGVQPGSLRPGILVRSTGRPLISANIFAGNGAEALWLLSPDPAILQRNAFSLSGKPNDRPKFRIVPPQEARP